MLRELPAASPGLAATAPSARLEDRERFHTGEAAMIALGHGVHDNYSAFLATMLPALIAKFALSHTQAGMLSVFSQWPSILQPFIGYAADRRSLKWMVIVAPGVTATAMSLLAIAPSYAVMAFLLLISGLASAGLHAVGPVYTGQVSGRALGRGMSFWMVGGELGRTVGPLVVAASITWVGLQGMPWLMAGGWLAALVLYLSLRRVPYHTGGASAPLPWRGALRAMAPIIAPLAVLLGMRAFLVSAMTIFLPTYLRGEGAPLWMAGAALALLQAAGSVGALISGSLSDRIGRRGVLFASLLLPPLLSFAFLRTAGGWLMAPVLILLGFTLLATTPVVMAIVQESFPQNRALANGIYMAISFLLFAGTTVAVGAMGDALGLRSAFAASAGLALVAVPMVPLVVRRA
jgi:FSR family fosmidomycin resistance protein-like MFS transporter